MTKLQAQILELIRRGHWVSGTTRSEIALALDVPLEKVNSAAQGLIEVGTVVVQHKWTRRARWEGDDTEILLISAKHGHSERMSAVGQPG